MSPVPEVFGNGTVPVVTTAVQLVIVVPAGAVSTMFTSIASLGPLLVTVIVYSTDSPGMYSVCPAVLVTFTVTMSACGSGVNGGVSQPSQVGSGSSVGVVTVTAFTRSSRKYEDTSNLPSCDNIACSGMLENVSFMSPLPLVF